MKGSSLVERVDFAMLNGTGKRTEEKAVRGDGGRRVQIVTTN